MEQWNTTIGITQEDMEREGEEYMRELEEQDDTTLGMPEAPMDEGFNTW